MRYGATSRLLAALSCAVVTATGLAGCSPEPDRDMIALLLPEDTTPRWEQVDRRQFTKAVGEMCADCEVEVYNAAGEGTTQRDQATRAREAGADVLVVASVDSETGQQVLADAGETPVIAYDRFIPGADYYVSFDPTQIGRMQAQGLVDAAGEDAHILRINGAEGEPNATSISRAVTEELESTKVETLATLDPPDWDPDTAADWLEQQLAELGDARIDAIYVTTDAQAGGVVEVMQKLGRELPVVTGQDGELGALQRIVRGEQTMTVYKSIPREAGRAARTAVSVIVQQPPEVQRRVGGVPAWLYQPRAVTIDSLTDTVVRDGAFSIEELCAGNMQARCEELGIA